MFDRSNPQMFWEYEYSLSTCALLFDFWRAFFDSQWKCFADKRYHLGLTLPTAHSSNTIHAQNQPWTHQPLRAEGRVSIATNSNPRQSFFSNWTHQNADRFRWRGAKSLVSFHPLPRRFVVVTLHSADVTNPSVVPQELCISFCDIWHPEESFSQFKSLPDYLPLSSLSLYSVAIFLLLDSVPSIDFAEYLLYTEALILEDWTPGTFLNKLFLIIYHCLHRRTLLAKAAISMNVEWFMLKVLFETSFKCVHAL